MWSQSNVDLNEKRKERKRRKKIHKKLFYYFIFINYKLIIIYDDIKLFLQKKKKIKTFQRYKSNFTNKLSIFFLIEGKGKCEKLVDHPWKPFPLILPSLPDAIHAKDAEVG